VIKLAPIRSIALYAYFLNFNVHFKIQVVISVNLYDDLPVYHGAGRTGIHNNMNIEALID
jgi:hypothetical protein